MAVCAQPDLPDSLAEGLRIVVSEQGTRTTIALDGWCTLARHNATRRDATRQAIRTALAHQHERKVLTSVAGLSRTHAAFTACFEPARHAARLKMNLVVIRAGERSDGCLISANPERITSINAG
jgi:hypothetical protein